MLNVKNIILIKIIVSIYFEIIKLLFIFNYFWKLSFKLKKKCIKILSFLINSILKIK
jgi:hypothetical protein